MTTTRTREEQIALLRERFVHRDDVYARQWFNEERNDGGYVKATIGECPPGSDCPRGACEHKKLVPLTDGVISAHLDAKRTVGVYQLADDDTIRWICFDVDKDKETGKDFTPEDLQNRAQEQARRIARQCQQYGFSPLVEDSGNRGYHVWLFTSPDCPAAVGRALGTYVMNHVAILSGLHVELFPKQVSARSLGNLVKLPLGMHLKSKRHSEFVSPSFQPVDDPFEALAKARVLSREDAQAFVDAHHIEIESIRKNDTPSMDIWTPACFVTILDEGVGDGARDIATFKLACYLRDKGLPYWLALDTLTTWDRSVNVPPLGNDAITIKVDSAYSDAYAWFPCGEYALDHWCTTSCHRWEAKKKLRRGEKATKK